jgi:alpha-glucosidase
VTPSHLFDPHHDGSPRYVLDRAPSLDDTVRVRVWVPGDPRPGPSEPDGVWLRSVRDGEPFIVPATPAGATGAGAWWEAGLLVGNPVTSYRFLLRYGDTYRWLNGAGVHDRDVTDAGDFRISVDHRLPDWVPDQVGYQVFPDRFARGGDPVTTPSWAQPADWDDPVVHRGPDVPFQWFGGTLDGVREHLDHLCELGATLLYLTPFFAARSNHRYDAASFDEVDPVLGGDAALRRLIDAAHDVGIRVVGDLTTNHTGETHPWFVAAQADPSSEERGFYRIHDDGSYESWLGVPSLPKLDHGSGEMRRRLYDGPDSVVARWLRHGLDGWRIDVANMTGRLGADDLAHDVARAIRRTLAADRP